MRTLSLANVAFFAEPNYLLQVQATMPFMHAPRMMLCPACLTCAVCATRAEYILKNGGLDTEKDYSYWSVGEMCNKNREGGYSQLVPYLGFD